MKFKEVSPWKLNAFNLRTKKPRKVIVYQDKPTAHIETRSLKALERQRERVIDRLVINLFSDLEPILGLML